MYPTLLTASFQLLPRKTTMIASVVTAAALFGTILYVLFPFDHGSHSDVTSEGDIPHFGLGTWLSDRDKVCASGNSPVGFVSWL